MHQKLNAFVKSNNIGVFEVVEAANVGLELQNLIEELGVSGLLALYCEPSMAFSANNFKNKLKEMLDVCDVDSRNIIEVTKVYTVMVTWRLDQISVISSSRKRSNIFETPGIVSGKSVDLKHHSTNDCYLLAIYLRHQLLQFNHTSTSSNFESLFHEISNSILSRCCCTTGAKYMHKSCLAYYKN